MSKPPELTGFQPIAQLGRGGTAEVIRVFSERHGYELALKYPPHDQPQSSATFAQLIRREEQLIGGLAFPGLVRILEISAEQPQYLLMDLCSGPTLDRCGKLENLSQALNVLSAIAVDLEYLHASHIIHGDLKPHNIFLPSDWRSLDKDRLFYVKLSDFSLGRFSHETDDARVGLGTVGYMAPETVAESRVTFQSDLFALGVIAYQLLTGVHPFADAEDDPVKTNSKVREEDPIPLSSLRQDLPENLVDLVDRLLAKDESDRPQSGWEVCQALRRTGARYPFEKALRPAHFFTSKGDNDERVTMVLQANAKQLARLNLLRNDSDTWLRLLLTANFVKGNLRYTGERFTFANGIYWPAILRRKTLGTFRHLPFGHKRLVIKAAVVGDRESVIHLGIAEPDQLRHISQPLLGLIRQFVRPRLVRRYSAAYASRAEELGLYKVAAQLYLQAGHLQGAERCAYQAAMILDKEHNDEAAVGIINQVVDYARIIGKVLNVRQLLMTLGDIHKQNGDTERALATYQQIIDLYADLLPDKLLAETYKDLGDLHRMRQDCEAGLKALYHALKIYKELGDELEISHTLNNIGNIHWIASDLDQALVHYRSALRIQRRLEVMADVASTLGNIAMIYVVNGRFKRSIHLMGLSLRVKKEIGNAGEIARSLNNLGYVYHLSGLPGKAVACLSESLSINRRIGSKKEVLYNLENLTAIMITAGQLKESLSYLKEGMELSEELGDRPHYGVFNLTIGMVFKRMGRFSKADERFAIVDSIIKEINDRMLSVQVTIQRARLRHFLGDNTDALRLASDALHSAEEINDKSAQLNALLVITRVSDDPHFINRTLSLTRELHLKRESTLVHFNHIESLLEQGKINEAQDAVDMTLSELDGIPEDIELPWMCNVAAELMIAIDNRQSALKYVSRAQRIADASGLMPEMVNALTLQGRLNFSMGEHEQCFKNYKSALQICKQIADNIGNEADRHLYQTKRSTLFLISEIKRLGRLMGQKQRAGS